MAGACPAGILGTASSAIKVRSVRYLCQGLAFLMLTIAPGASSTSQREDTGAFATQFEGATPVLFSKSDVLI